jgi:hypothetical protein
MAKLNPLNEAESPTELMRKKVFWIAVLVTLTGWLAGAFR